MREKPDVPDEMLIACLRAGFGVHARDIAFLPIGNDVDTAAYRVTGEDATPYFLKLRGWRRSGRFDPTTVTIPHFLHDAGIAQVIAPLPTRDGRLWADLDAYAAILFPFIAGTNGFQTPLTDRHWGELGAALRAMHALAVPPALGADIAREDYAPRRRDAVRAIQRDVEQTRYTDAIAAQMATFLRAERDLIAHMVSRAETLAAVLRAESPPCVLCHADIHAANVLLAPDGALYIVDWDTLIFAPKERDLMFIGGGIGGTWHTERETALFYRWYGRVAINAAALVYYRYERIIEDIAEYGARLLMETGGADRAVGFEKFSAAFAPGNVVETACRTDRTLAP